MARQKYHVCHEPAFFRYSLVWLDKSIMYVTSQPFYAIHWYGSTIVSCTSRTNFLRYSLVWLDKSIMYVTSQPFFAIHRHGSTKVSCTSRANLFSLFIGMARQKYHIRHEPTFFRYSLVWLDKSIMYVTSQPFSAIDWYGSTKVSCTSRANLFPLFIGI